MAEIKKTGKCAICGGRYTNFGHNPQPLLEYEERVCTSCNDTKVLPARLAAINSVVQDKQVDEEACRRQLSELWHKYGMAVLLRSLGKMIDADAREVEKLGLFAEEVEKKDELAGFLRNTADWMEK